MNNNDDKKLDWMYKGANSLVDREEYLLGRSVDKTLEQLNAEEKEKKLGLVPPKNHVEHECIPPSIRDFNKIVQAEQVDISAKLQEDPLVAIKKREEEARRQFLQNPVQLKKLQEALKEQQMKKKKKKQKKSKFADSDSDLDNKIVKKLKYLKDCPPELISSKKLKKKSKDDVLDTILMHKFNQLKDKLSQDDLNEILACNTSDSDKETKHKKRKNKTRHTSSDDNSSDSETKRNNRKGIRANSKVEEKNRKRDKKYSSSDDESTDHESKKKDRKENRSSSMVRSEKSRKKNRSTSSSSSSSEESEEEKKNSHRKNEIKRKQNRDKSERNEENYGKSRYVTNYRSRNKSIERDHHKSNGDVNKAKNTHKRDLSNERYKSRREYSIENDIKKTAKEEYNKKLVEDPESDLESKILKKLRMLRDSVKSKEEQTGSKEGGRGTENETNHQTKGKDSSSESTSDESSDENQSKKSRYHESDSDEDTHKPKAFGLIKSDGTKLALNRTRCETNKSVKPAAKDEVISKPTKKNVKKLSEEEKEKLRREMMKNAEKRDKERSDNLKRYRDEDKREERESSNYKKDFLHKELLKTTKDATVETRIKSNLNNIQRSSRHMDSHFSRRN